jgi:hypothetical protein
LPIKQVGARKKKETITEAAKFLEVTISFLSRCVREGKPCKGVRCDLLFFSYIIIYEKKLEHFI